MLKKILLPFLFLTLSSFSFSDFFTKKSFIYNNKVNNQNTTSNILLSKKDANILITKSTDKDYTSLQYTKDYKLLNLSFKSENKAKTYEFINMNNLLVCSGVIGNKKINKSYKLSNKTWVQDFTFGLTPFLESKKKEFKFFILNPDDFSKNNMIATKLNISNIKINNKNFLAQKVNVTLRGFKSHFWKAEIYFDTKTHDLLKYISDEGPGTPTIVTTLLEIK
jgi:hypothetical protein